ncbi:MAG: hypothetical protein GY711_34160 [bacterium]|nr:hypothetical protein [bacterium]
MEAGALESTLKAAGEVVGAARLEWVDAVGEADGGPRDGSRRELDWGLARRMGPGAVLELDALGRRSPRAAAAAPGEVWIAASGSAPVPGFLRVVGRPRADGPGLCSLADLASQARRTDEALRGARAGRRERELGRRVATLTHDLRNQLTLAVLLAERLRSEGTPEELDRLEGVLCAARELCAATLAGDQAPASPRSLVLRGVLVEEARAASALARGSLEVGMRVRCAANVRVFCDLTALTRLVRNLMVNAVEASFDSGEVRIAVAAEGAGDGGLVLVIEDDGRGMSRLEVARLFGAGESGKPGGTGYGSASLAECLATLGGELEVETAPGAGTTVRVRLPAPPDPDRPAALVLDGDARRLNERAREAADAGYGVWRAANAEAALAILRGTAPALALIARGTRGDDMGPVRAQLERARTRVVSIAAGQRVAGLLGSPGAPPELP